MIFNMVDGAPEFLSTPSGWRATSSDGVHPIQYGYISIHALRVEGDYLMIYCYLTVSNFYPRPPGGGRLPFF